MEKDTSNRQIPIGITLKRAFSHIEKGEFDEAEKLCRQVSDIAPENGSAYYLLLLACKKCKSGKELMYLQTPLDGDENYKNALTFGDPGQKAELSGYADFIKYTIYKNALDLMLAANTPEEYKGASELFLQIGEYKDADILYKTCMENSEKSEKEKRGKRHSSDKGSKKGLILKFVFWFIIALLVVGSFWGVNYKKSKKYDQAMDLYENGRYEEAEEYFKILGSFKNSREMAEKCSEK